MSVYIRNNFILVLLNGFILLNQLCEGHEKRILTANADVTQAHLHQLELSIQSLKAQMLGEILDLHNQMQIKDKQISDLSTQLSNIQRKVAFMAEVTGSYLHQTTGQHLVYDKVYLNDGNGYHPFHGTFIAPVDGLYEFSMGVTAHTGGSTGTHVNMMKSGSSIGYLFFDGLDIGYPWIKESESILTDLKAGEEVWVQVTSAGGPSGTVQIATGSMHTYFSGYLINSNP